jgi:hypothetical protein
VLVTQPGAARNLRAQVDAILDVPAARQQANKAVVGEVLGALSRGAYG